MSGLFMRRAALTLSRRAPAISAPTRTFTSSIKLCDQKKDQHANPKPGEPSKHMKPFEEIKTESDLLAPGGQPGTIPTDLEQATGLERLEILGKMQGVDIFDMKPLDASRRGTLKDPIMVKSFGNEQYVGCTGCPADSHNVIWLTISRDRPLERCPECGSVYKMEYIGPADDGHGHDHGHDIHDSSDGVHNYAGEPKTMADFVRPEYR